MNDDGTMARLPDLQVFAQTHGLKIGTIADLIAFRSHNESLIERVAERTMTTPQGDFDCRVYRDRSGGLHIALRHGRWNPKDEVLVRVHEPFTAIDLLDATPGRHSWPLPKALAEIHRASAGVAVLLNCNHEADTLLGQLTGAAPAATTAPGAAMDLRTYGVGAQILRDLGVARMRLLGSPRRMPSMAGYGLEVGGFVASSAAPT
jgi:3,4-dihydroxy 2-butanone 4-phosphate synthase/GTP cyclohydrolase II